MTSEAGRPRRMGRSVVAVLAGFAVVVALSLGTDVAMHAIGIFPRLGDAMSDALFLLRQPIAPFTLSRAAMLRRGSHPIAPWRTPWQAAASALF